MRFIICVHLLFVLFATPLGLLIMYIIIQNANYLLIYFSKTTLTTQKGGNNNTVEIYIHKMPQIVGWWGVVPLCGPRPAFWSWYSPQAGPSSLLCSSGSSGCWAVPVAGGTWAARGSALCPHCPPPTLQPGSDLGYRSHHHPGHQGSTMKDDDMGELKREYKQYQNHTQQISWLEP